MIPTEDLIDVDLEGEDTDDYDHRESYLAMKVIRTKNFLVPQSGAHRGGAYRDFHPTQSHL
jgi:hypothetical protein